MEAINEVRKISYDDYKDAVLEDTVREGDLLKMVLPLECNVPEFAAKTDIEQEYKYVGKFRSIDDMRIQTKLAAVSEEKNEDETTILMFRDSFGRALIPIMSNQFEEATYLRPTPFNIYGNIQGKDVVIREIVERNISLLLEDAPLVTAMKVSEESLPDSEHLKILDEKATVITEEASSGKLTHLYGFAEINGAENMNYRVFAKCGDNLYEGFPIYESSLTDNYGEQGADRLGFSFYFEKSAEDSSALAECTFYYVSEGA